MGVAHQKNDAFKMSPNARLVHQEPQPRGYATTTHGVHNNVSRTQKPRRRCPWRASRARMLKKIRVMDKPKAMDAVG